MNLRRSRRSRPSRRNTRRSSNARLRNRRASRLRFETLEARRLLAGDVQFRFEFTDPADNPVDSVGVGEAVRLRAFVQDLRDTPQGVSSAYFDIVWENPRVLTTGDPMVHGPEYDTETSGDSTMFPRIEDAGGGFDGIAPDPSDAGDEFLLFTLPLVASSAGTFQFHPEMADGFGRDILLVGSGTPVPFDPENVMVVGDTSLEVVPTVAFEQAISDVNEEDGSHSVNVVLDTGGEMLSDSVTVNVVTLPSSTATSSNFTLDTTSVTFPAASTGGTMPVSLTILSNSTGDGNVYVDLGLEGPSVADAGLGHLDRHHVTIVDDDLDRVQVEVNLYADQNGQPGVILTDGVVNTGEAFFVEIVVGDYRDDPPAPGDQRGVIGMRVDSFSWPLANVVSLNEFPIDNPLNPIDPNPLITSEFPLSRTASLVNPGGGAQAIEDLVGFSNPTGGQGTAIGINRPQQFSLMHFVANTPTATAVALLLDVDTDTITLADNSDPANTSVQQTGVRVNNFPVAGNDGFGVDGNSANNLLDVLDNDSDAQMEVLTITAVTDPSNGGTVSIVGTPGTLGHQLLYTPPAGFRGSETFIYTMTDGNQLSEATAMVTVDVDPLRIEKATNADDPSNPTSQEDADDPPGQFLAVGTDVVWTYQVFNEGGRPLDITEIVDDAGTPFDTIDDFIPDPVLSSVFNVGDTNRNNLLDPEEVWRFTSNSVVTYEVLVGQYTNASSVTAEAVDNDDVLNAGDPSNHFGVDAQVALVKKTNGQDAESAPGVFIAVGDPANFTYEVSNPGNVALQLVEIVDDAGTPGNSGDDFRPDDVEDGNGFNIGDSNQNDLIDLDETWLFEAERNPVTEGQYTNEATVTANPVDAQGVDLDGFDDAEASDISNHFGVELTSEDLLVSKQTNGEEADSPPGPFLEVGSTVTFDYEVTLDATANVPVMLTSLVDDNGTPGEPGDHFTPTPIPSVGPNDGDDNQNGLIDPGETWLFTATRPVTPGQYTNTVVAIVTPTDSGGVGLPEFDPVMTTDSSSHFGTVVEIALEKLTNGEDADTPPGPRLPIGSVALFTYEATNPGNVPLDIIELIDDNGTLGDTGDDFSPSPVPSTGPNSGDTDQNGLLDPGEIWLFAASRDPVTAGQYTNSAKITANPVDFSGADLPDFENAEATDVSNHFGNPIVIQKATNAVDPTNPTSEEDADSAPGRFMPIGTNVVWTYLVSNAGDDPLSIVEIVDDFGTPSNPSDDFNPAAVEGDGDGVGFNMGDVNQNDLVDLGEVWQFTSEGVKPFAATVGQYSNTVAISADIPSTGGTAEDSDPSNLFGVMTEIALEKETNNQDADTPPGPIIEVGQAAAFMYTVGNPGNVPLAIVEIVDDNGTPSLPDDDFSPIPIPSSGPNVGDTNQNGLLDPGEIWMYEAVRNPVTPGQYTNTATIIGNPVDFEGTDLPDFSDVQNSDSSNHFGANASIVVQKSTNGEDADNAPGPFIPVGGVAMFEYGVANDGNVAVALIDLVDDAGTPDFTLDDFEPNPIEINFRNVGDANRNDLIDPGETWLYEATRDPVTVGQYTNKVTARANPVDDAGEDISGLPDVMDMDTSNHFGALINVEDLDLQKATNGEDADSPPGPPAGVGTPAIFTYELSLSSAANVPVSIVDLVDDNGTPGDTGDDFRPDDVEDDNGFNIGDTNQNGLVDPGETWLFRASKPVTPGQYTNIAGVTVNPVDPSGGDIPGLQDLAATDSSNHFGVNAEVELTKRTDGQDADDAPGPVIPAGDIATFSYEVENTGDVPLDFVSLIDDNGTPGDPGDISNPTPVPPIGFNIGDANQNDLIDPGETWLFEAMRDPVTPGQFTNTAVVIAKAVDAQGDDVPGIDNVQGMDASNHFGAFVSELGMLIEKATNGEDADTPPGVAIAVGGMATFTYEVSLPAATNVPVSIIALTDDNGTPSDTGDDFTPDDVEDGNGFNIGDTNENDLVDPGENWRFVATRDPVPLGQYTNKVVVVGNPVDFDGVDIEPLDNIMGMDQSNHFGAVASQIFVEKFTNGDDADTAPGPFLPVGSAATFTYVVNSGDNVNVPVAIVELTDDNGTPIDTSDDFTPDDVENGNGFNIGDTNENGLVDPGESWRFEATRLVTAGQYTNTVVVLGNPVDFDGNDIDGLDELTDTDTSNHFGARVGEVLLIKQTNGEDADSPPGPVILVGQTALFTYEASLPADANVPVEIEVLVDDNGTPVNDSDDFTPDDVEDGNGFNIGDTTENGLLDPGETWVFTAVRDPVTPGQYTNTVVIVANPVDPQENDIPEMPNATGTDTSNHFGALIDTVDVEKATNGEDADSPTGPELPQGSTATFTYEVSIPAPGNVPVDITGDNDLIDDNGTPLNTSDDFRPDDVDDDDDGFNDGDTNTNRLVDPGETWLFEASRIVTIGQYTNTVSLTADPVDFDGGPIDEITVPLTDSDQSNHLGILGPSTISGSTYIDANGNGIRDLLSNGDLEVGIPGVLIVLLDDMGDQIDEMRTDDEGRYRFEDLLTGVYQLAQAQPIAFIDGQTAAGNFGGDSETNLISEILVPPNGDGVGYQFGELGIRPEYISKRMFLASTPSFVEILRELAAIGEDPIPVLIGQGVGEGESAGTPESFLDASDFPSFPADGEGERSPLLVAPASPALPPFPMVALLPEVGGTGLAATDLVAGEHVEHQRGAVAAIPSSASDDPRPSADPRDDADDLLRSSTDADDFATAVDQALGGDHDWL